MKKNKIDFNKISSLLTEDIILSESELRKMIKILDNRGKNINEPTIKNNIYLEFQYID